jgi:hypothetical protein
VAVAKEKGMTPASLAARCKLAGMNLDEQEVIRFVLAGLKE